MHPNPSFRHNDHALFETLIHEIGFGMIFATTPDGPRVAHTPLLSTGNGTVQFHLARGNALTHHLAGMDALAVINGPEAERLRVADALDAEGSTAIAHLMRQFGEAA